MPEDEALKALIARHTPKPRQRQESNLLPRVVARAAKLGAKLFRNNVGTLRDRHGRYVTYGLCVGSSDLIGYTSCIVTQDMVGQRVAIFTAIETKAPKGIVSDRQSQFIADVKLAGGIAAVVRDVTELDGLFLTDAAT